MTPKCLNCYKTVYQCICSPFTAYEGWELGEGIEAHQLQTKWQNFPISTDVIKLYERMSLAVFNTEIKRYLLKDQ